MPANAPLVNGPNEPTFSARPNSVFEPSAYADAETVLPLVVVPLNPGKNITVVSEVVAMNHLLRYSGVDPALAFNQRLLKKMAEQKELREYLAEDYE